MEEWAPAPFYTKQAAIIHRKLGQQKQEIAVLKRWLSKVPKGQRPKDVGATGGWIVERLAKLKASGLPQSKRPKNMKV